MKIGIAILSRFSSRRLPGKALHLIGDRCLLDRVVARAEQAGLPLAIATSDDPSDDAIERYARRAGVACHRGSLENVTARLLSCARAHGWDFVIRINGDNVFTDPQTIRALALLAGTGTFDFLTNVPGRSFPFGMSVEVLRTDFLELIERDFDDSDREHVTKWLYDHPAVGRRYVLENHEVPEARGLQLAIDTPDDVERAARIIDASAALDLAFCRLTLREIVRLATHPPTNFWHGRHGPMLVAEIGGNHEGSFDAARRLCELAIDSGADSVKFQIYSGDKLVSPVESPDRNKHFKRFELAMSQHIELAQMCKDGGVIYAASVWDEEALDAMDPHLAYYKVGSGDLTAWPLLRAHAVRGKPILLSTGLATLEEVLQTVRFLQRANPIYLSSDYLCVLQCTSMYPIPIEEAGLNVMKSLRRETRLSVGYSDHTVGSNALRTAAAMGADVLEFHFTDSRDGRTFRDHAVSLTRDEVRQLAAQIAEDRRAMGSAVKLPTKSEVETGHVTSFRRAVYPGRRIAAGDRIQEHDLVTLRPMHGTDARDFDAVAGSTAVRDLEPFSAIREGVDFERGGHG